MYTKVKLLDLYDQNTRTKNMLCSCSDLATKQVYDKWDNQIRVGHCMQALINQVYADGKKYTWSS